MRVSSLEFVLCLLLISAVVPLLASVRARQWALALCNFAFLGSYLPNGLSWVVLGVFLLSGYVAGLALRRRPGAAGLAVYLIALIAAFTVLKNYGFVDLFVPEHIFAHPVAIVGLSYMLFRQIHFVVDLMQGQIEDPRLWDYTNYQLDFCALVAGPIQRYQDFCASWHSLTLPAGRHELLTTYLRLFVGIIKVVGLAAAALFLYEKVEGRLAGVSSMGTAPSLLYVVSSFAVVFYAYPLYVYLNFSGYCDIAISAGALLGIRLPENFDRPFLSRNMLEFWTRWHRTLGFWIRDYLFTPAYKAMAERTAGRTTTLAVISYFFAFLLAGVWHGTTSNFAVFGALHGLGASCTKLWEAHLIRRGGRAHVKRYLQRGGVRAAAIVLTLHYFCLTMVFFSAPLHRSTLPFRVLFDSFRASLTAGDTSGSVTQSPTQALRACL